ncbi:WRKY transcription factor [Musa troglodytarum]|uniref:WRKY transcription factor n=1 Tax=Musa troglodytarum TaxID=320322 RepID=A0A9E7HFM5_9LILI|nr:WRKY transcription factor [Musa troglodytarum]
MKVSGSFNFFPYALLLGSVNELLGWMHRKFRQNSGDVLKDYGSGGTCNCLSGRPSLGEDLHRRRRSQYEPFKARSLRLEVEELIDGGNGGGGNATMEELLGGLLSIGTLGSGTGPMEDKEEEEEEEENEAGSEDDEKQLTVSADEEVVVTPAALEAIAEKEAESTTETDLLVVSAELEKVLTAEAEKGGGRISSARSSYAGSAACPLQGFLFGSPIEVAETMATAADARKERRASLGELFMISRITEEEGGGGGGNAEHVKLAGGHDEEGKSTAEICLMKKKMTKRRGVKGSDGSGPSNGSTADTKFQKILQFFHKKVHPESSIVSKKPSTSKTGKNEKKEYAHLVGGSEPTGTDGCTAAAAKVGPCRKEHIPDLNFCYNPASHAFGGNDSSGSREHWIKTDADCKYLIGTLLLLMLNSNAFCSI